MKLQGGGARLGDFQPMTSADLSPQPQEQDREQRPEADTSGMAQTAAASDQTDDSAPAKVRIDRMLECLQAYNSPAEGGACGREQRFQPAPHAARTSVTDAFTGLHLACSRQMH